MPRAHSKTTKKSVMKSGELERQRLVSLINSMADGVIAVDEKASIVVSNGAALNILDINNPMVGESIQKAIKLIDKNNQPLNIRQIVLGTKTSTAWRDWRLKYADGEAINVYVSIAPVQLGYGQGGTKGYVLLLRNITREKSLEEERDEFIDVVSHELRTPIAIAEGNIGNAEFLFAKPNASKQSIVQALNQAHQQINFLAGLINDLATLSRAERGKLTIEVENINVHELLDDLIKDYQAEAEVKGLKLTVEPDARLELLRSSRLYVQEILQNFITNAIKYTNEGHVCIGAKPSDNGVKFYVADSGIGIGKRDQEKVFDKFFRSEDYQTRASKGTGLGLYVTMKLARRLHAEIDLESELDKGSTFTIFVPNLH